MSDWPRYVHGSGQVGSGGVENYRNLFFFVCRKIYLFDYSDPNFSMLTHFCKVQFTVFNFNNVDKFFLKLLLSKRNVLFCCSLCMFLSHAAVFTRLYISEYKFKNTVF